MDESIRHSGMKSTPSIGKSEEGSVFRSGSRPPYLADIQGEIELHGIGEGKNSVSVLEIPKRIVVDSGLFRRILQGKSERPATVPDGLAVAPGQGGLVHRNPPRERSAVLAILTGRQGTPGVLHRKNTLFADGQAGAAEGEEQAPQHEDIRIRKPALGPRDGIRMDSRAPRELRLRKARALPELCQKEPGSFDKKAARSRLVAYGSFLHGVASGMEILRRLLASIPKYGVDPDGMQP